MIDWKKNGSDGHDDDDDDDDDDNKDDTADVNYDNHNNDDNDILYRYVIYNNMENLPTVSLTCFVYAIWWIDIFFTINASQFSVI